MEWREKEKFGHTHALRGTPCEDKYINRVMPLQVKECSTPPADPPMLVRDVGQILSQPAAGGQPCQHLDLGSLAPELRGATFLLLETPRVWWFVRGALAS